MYSAEQLQAMAVATLGYRQSQPELYLEFLLVLSMAAGVDPEVAEQKIIAMSRGESV